jgi:hypothetical protein
VYKRRYHLAAVQDQVGATKYKSVAARLAPRLSTIIKKEGF